MYNTKGLIKKHYHNLSAGGLAGLYSAMAPFEGSSHKKRKMAPIKNKKKSIVLKVGRQNPINQLANRASMKLKGRKNQKVKSTKKVVVSKSLREKVNKVIAGNDAYGAYYKFYSGSIGIVDPGVSGDTLRYINLGRDTSCIASHWPAAGSPSGGQYWWGGLHGTTATGLNYLGESQMFSYFDPQKILDAASVLFNRKATTTNWTAVTGNLSTTTNSTTGQYIAGSPTFPNAGSLKVRVINSYVTWRMKNTSQRTLYVTIYNCVPKIKFAPVMPLTTIGNASDLTSAANIDTTYFSGNVVTSQQNAIISHPCFKPTQYRPFNSTYKTSTMTMVINPGEECVHNIQGPKNYTVDFGKLYPNGGNEAGGFYKDTTVNCMVSVQVDAVAFTSGTVAGTAPLTYTSGGENALLVDPLDITVCEVTKVACPEIAGFIINALPAGAQQVLNQRKEKVVYYNLNQTSSSGDVYVAFDEEAPQVSISKSVTN